MQIPARETTRQAGLLVASLLVIMAPDIVAGECACQVLQEQHASCGSSPLESVPDCVPDTITDLQIAISNVQSDSFHRFPQLQSLTLRASGLTSLPDDAFENNGQLFFLDLGINSLTTIQPETLSTLVNLQHLYLDNNGLSTLPSDLLRGNGQLRVLSLSSNQLTSLEVSTLEATPLLTQLQINGNGATLPCDCQLKTLIDWTLQKGVSLGRGWTTCNKEGAEMDVYAATAQLQC